jgi:hypothetical protein
VLGRAASSSKNKFILPEKPPIDGVGKCVTPGQGSRAIYVL